MSKIFFSVAALSQGGAERVLSILSKDLANNFDEVQYIMWYDLPVFYSVDPRIRLISIEKESGCNNMFGKMRWFRKYINSNKPDLILSFSAPFNMLTLASLLFTTHKVIACERVDPRSFRWGKHLEILRNLLYKKACGILAQTQISKDYFKGSLYDKTEIIFNPVSMNYEEVGSAIKSCKRNLIVTAARLAKQKNHISLITTFAKFKETHPDYRLIIYGEGPERSTLENLIKKLDLSDSVFLPGSVKDLWDRIKSARLFVMTSFVEGMSNSMIEAMCLGIPTISTKVSGATDLIVTYKNGILINIDDDKELYDAMCKVCDNDDLAVKLGKNGARLYDKLKVEEISKQWIEYIKEKIE
ncbi:MAG: glycosyltransferase [Ruminococcus sp.]|nr:glycosyltransferase [Ruminococcus sp.]